MIQILKKMEDGVLTFKMTGHLDENGSPVVEKELDQIVYDNIQTILFDLSAVDYISSIGIRTLIFAHKQAVKYNKTLKITALSPKGKNILEVVGLLPLFMDTKG